MSIERSLRDHIAAMAKANAKLSTPIPKASMVRRNINYDIEQWEYYSLIRDYHQGIIDELVSLGVCSDPNTPFNTSLHTHVVFSTSCPACVQADKDDMEEQNATND